MLKRAESDDDRRICIATDKQAANKRQALRGDSSDTKDVARLALRERKESLYDADAQDKDESKKEATVKEEEVRSRENAFGRRIFEILLRSVLLSVVAVASPQEPSLIPELAVSNEEVSHLFHRESTFHARRACSDTHSLSDFFSFQSDDEVTLFDRPPFDPYNVSSESDSHFVSVGPEASMPSVSGTSPHVQVHMPPHRYTYFTPPHLVYAHQPHPSSGASSLTAATPFGYRMGEAPSYFSPFHGGYVHSGFADYRSIYETHREDDEGDESEEEDSKPAAKARSNGATSNEAVVIEDQGQNPIAATVSKDSVDFGVCATPDGGLVISDRNGTAIALFASDSTDVAALFCHGKIKVTNLLTSGGGTEVTKLLNNPGLENVAVTQNRKYARWTEDEDDTLREAIVKYNGPPPYNWKRISRKYFKGLRSDVQCKNRWKKVSQSSLFCMLDLTTAIICSQLF
jgi:hypothetical protein